MWKPPAKAPTPSKPALSRAAFNTLAEQHSAIALVILQAVARNLSNRLHITIAELQALRG